MDLNQLKALWRENGFRPEKTLGQNFLIDKNVKNNILKALDPAEDTVVLEIGAGFGMMSFDLAGMCGKLFAVEKDDRICGVMAPIFHEKKNITFLHADILDIDICKLSGKEGRILVFGNIPYCISTPIIERMIAQKKCISAVYIVIQAELADRIVSPPGSKKYGSISCFVRYHAAATKILKIKRNCFLPKPDVDSCLLKLEMLRTPSVKVRDEKLMFKIIRTAFWQRRKKAINPLSSGKFETMGKTEWQEIFEACEIDPSSRAESLSLTDYARLSDQLRLYT